MLYNKKFDFLGLLYICVFLIFLGRSLELLVWEAPLRAFFWDENILKPVVEDIFNQSWTKYTKSSLVDTWIQRLNYLFGIILFLASLSTLFLFANNNKKIFKVFIILGIIVVGLILILEYKEKFYHTAQFLEGFTQFFTPIFLLLFVNKKITPKQLSLGLRAIIAFTFVGHGLYAINLYATPGYFIDMIIVILGAPEDFAKELLWIVGWLDILLLVLLFVPFVKKVAVYYAIIWGLLTALARFVYPIKLLGIDFDSINMIHSTIYRLPHGLVPLAILLLINYNNKTLNNESI